MRTLVLFLSLSVAACGSTFLSKRRGSYDVEPGLAAAPAPETPAGLSLGAMSKHESTDTFDESVIREVGTPEELAGQERLLIYSGRFSVAVGNIESAQQAAREMAESLGGYFQSLKGDTITLRVPADRWEEAVAGVTKLGRVLDREIDAADVTEEVVDLRLRLRNAKSLLARLEQLLAKAENVEAALKVETELARVRTEVERLEGRLKFLADRISYSTLTIRFLKAAEATARPQALPFPWLTELSLDNLLDLSGGVR